MNQSKAHSRALRTHREQEVPGTFFITKCLEPRIKILDKKCAKIIADAVCFYAEKGQICLGAFVVMLDHWHALFATIDGKTIAKRMRTLDHWVSGKTGAELAGCGTDWQDGYYDTRIKSSLQFNYVRSYVEENPVRAGLVDARSDWPWSSAHPAYKKYVTDAWPWRFEKD